KSQTQALSMQAVLPVFHLITVIDYCTCQSNLFVCTPIQQHLIFQSVSFIPLISPAITLYNVQPYRIFAENILCLIKNKSSAKIHTISGNYATFKESAL
ncbi:hypothetical protein PMAYCL1PPCAC_16224, partial [Pristionchus mayeri]